MQHFRLAIARRLAALTSLDEAELARAVAAPPRPEMGDLAFGCFALAKSLRKAPPAIAADLAARWGEAGAAPPGIRAEAAGPYVNFRLETGALAHAAADLGRRARGATIRTQPPLHGAPPVVTIDYSSPNIAKQFSIAHLRSTATGWSLRRMYDFAGFKTVGINHIGDWGTQFGLLIGAFRSRGDESRLEHEPIKYLHELYVSAVEEAEKDPAVKDRARAAFLALERGDADATALWKRFRDLSLREFDRVYALLGITFDTYDGEAFYNDKIEPVFERLRAAGIAHEDAGAWIVDVPGFKAPMLLRKSDGASTYGTRDLAALAYRHRTYDFARNVYVVDIRQEQHFQQLFAVYAMLGEAEKEKAARCVHVPFGTVKIDGQIGSSRRGTIILLEEYLGDMAAEVLRLIDEKNPDLPDKEGVARAIGLGAVVFEMLKKDRRLDVHFKSEEVLKTDGETGPRVQYLHARLCSLARTFEKTFGCAVTEGDLDGTALEGPEAHQLLLRALAFEDALDRALEESAPHHVARWVLELADAFNVFWREVRVIDPEDEAASARRMVLMEHLRVLIRRALWLLGVEAPEQM